MKGLTGTGRTWMLRGLVSAVAVAALSATAPAQDSTAAGGFRIHTVHAGENLWDIAQTYLGDGDLWPEIVQANKHLVQDSHWIFPNEVLRIPPRAPGAPADNGAAVAAQPAPSAPVATNEPMQPAATPAAAPDSGPPPDVAAGAPPAADDAGASAPATTPDDAGASAPGATLFNHPPQGTSMFAASTNNESRVARRREGVSPGDHNSAPYLDRDGGPRNAGSVVGVADMSNVIDAADVEHYGLDQELYIRLPRGSHPEVGQRYYTYALDQSFGDHGQIIVPTGIVLVTHPGTDKIATTVRIVQQFAYMQLGQGVLPIDPAILPDTRPAPLPSGSELHVVWVEHDQVLPTIGFYIVVDGAAKAGVRIGDQVTLYRPRKELQSPDGAITLPESDIAVAQVVRVTPYGASAVIIHQDQPAVEPGVAARVTARVTVGQ
jgi:nucleoid-associated protein YgaU